MKKMLFVLCCAVAMGAMGEPTTAPLFGEKLANADYNPAIWSMDENGILKANKDAAIWTKEKIGDCKVSFEYNLSPKANAGFLIKCSDKGNWIPNTIEIQILDDHGSQPSYHGNAAFYGYQAPTKVATKPAGEWNKMVVECKGTVIKVWLNDEFVNEMDMSQWKDKQVSPKGTPIEKKFQGKALADADTVGYIGFQGLHGKSSILYRNITITK